MNTVRILAITTVACGLTGCGARDTEIDSIPGPGARSTTPPAIEQHRLDPATGTTAGVNSVGRPADSAGGNPGAPTVIGASQPEGAAPAASGTTGPAAGTGEPPAK